MEKDKLVSLKLIGFSERETEQFSAVLDLAERGLQQSWHIVEAASADFFILAEGLPVEQINNLPHKRCLFCVSEESASGDNSFLVDSTKRVPRLSSLIERLNRAAEDYLAFSSVEPIAESIDEVQKNAEPEYIQANVESGAPISDTQVEEVFFNPEQGLLTRLLQTKTQPFSLAVKSQTDCSDIYIYPAHKACYCKTSLEQFSPYFNGQIEWLEKTSYEAEWDAAVLSQPLSSLAWYTTLKSPHGRLMPGYSEHVIVYLTRLSDRGIPDCRKFVKLAAFMKNNAVPLDMAVTEINSALAQVYDFYNACQLTGLIEKTTETKIHQKAVNDDKPSLFARISNRLKNQPSKQR